MPEIKEYIHTVKYYETDKMGVTHHSNYIRWMEEARIDLLTRIGWDYAKLEAMGIVSAVVSLTCDFKRPTTFPDKIAVRAAVTEFKGVTLKFSYEMKNADGVTVCTGTSVHVFLNAEGRPISVKRKHPELFETFNKLAAQDAPEE